MQKHILQANGSPGFIRPVAYNDVLHEKACSLKYPSSGFSLYSDYGS